MMIMMVLFRLMIFITVNFSAFGTKNAQKVDGQKPTQAVVTVRNVPVQQGKSIIIPCLYKAKYINYPKYLCFGYSCNSCTDGNQMKHRMVSISDNQTQHIFTVTMKDLTTGDAGHYCCSVGTPFVDVKNFQLKFQRIFELKVTQATPELYVDDQKVTVYEGNHVVISCYHQTKETRAWCKIGGACVYTTGNISGASVQLSNMDGGFRVTMSELTMDNTGWYFCSAGHEQMPVHITVQGGAPSWERSSFAWLIFLALLLVLACMAVIVFRQHKQKWEMFSFRKRSENTYVSMRKSKLQTEQQEDEDAEAQVYEIMSCPKKTQENPECNENAMSQKTDGGHPTYKDDFVLKGPYCTC